MILSRLPSVAGLGIGKHGAGLHSVGSIRYFSTVFFLQSWGPKPVCLPLTNVQSFPVVALFPDFIVVFGRE